MYITYINNKQTLKGYNFFTNKVCNERVTVSAADRVVKTIEYRLYPSVCNIISDV